MFIQFFCHHTMVFPYTAGPQRPLALNYGLIAYLIRLSCLFFGGPFEWHSMQWRYM